MKKLAMTVAAMGLILSLAGMAQASDLIFDRGLPVYNSSAPNLNDVAGANRSNVAWYDSDWATGWFTGDDFTIAGSGQQAIQDLTVWVVGGTGYDTFTLWTGTGGNVTQTRTSNLSDTNIAFTQVHYSDGSDYQGNSGAMRSIYELTFKNLNWTVDKGSLYNFGVSSKAADETFLPVALHASNAALSNSTQEGADGSFYGFDNGTLNYTWDTGTDGGWDKSSDINVQITPEPATMALLALGGAAALVRRVRRKA